VEAIGAALADSDRPLVLASGMLGLTTGGVATEDEGLVAGAEVRANPAGRRAATALFTLSLRGVGVRSSVLRFPPTVDGDGDNGVRGLWGSRTRPRALTWASTRAARIARCRVRRPPLPSRAPPL